MGSEMCIRDRPEVEHAFRGGDSYSGYTFGRSWRAAREWFGYELNGHGETSLQLRLTHWGQAWSPLAYTVEINGQEVGDVNVSGREGENFIDHHVEVPAQVSTAGPMQVTFRAQPDSPVPPLYEIRLIRPKYLPD